MCRFEKLTDQRGGREGMYVSGYIDVPIQKQNNGINWIGKCVSCILFYELWGLALVVVVHSCFAL